MAKLSDKIDLSKAVKKAEVIVDSSGSMSETENPVEALLNSDKKANKEKQKKKKKASEAQTTEENSLFAELLPKEEEKPQGEKWPKTYEETCEYDLRRAHEKGYPDPDFDFRKIYTKGMRMWFVRIMASLGEKELIEVVLNTIYPRMIVAVQPKAFCHCIGYNMQDQLFSNHKDALQFYESVQVSSRYKTERPMKRQEDDVEEDGDAYPEEQTDEEGDE